MNSAPLFDALQLYAPLWILWGAVVLNLLIPLPYAMHPMRIWGAFANVLAEKVNRQQGQAQDAISGALASLLMLLPAVALFEAIEVLAWQDHYFQLVLLYLAFDWRQQLLLAHQLGQQLASEDKTQARQTLQPLLNRQCDTLSLVGLGKAATETLIAGQTRHVICVLFWFALSGGLGAFTYRLISELHRAWSPSQSGFRPFGLFNARLLLLLEWVPAHLFAVVISIGQHGWLHLQQARAQIASWPSPSQGLLLALIGNKFQLSLGGPAIYATQKRVRAKLGGRIAPSALHISQLMRILNQRTLAWLLLQSLIMALFLSVFHA